MEKRAVLSDQPKAVTGSLQFLTSCYKEFKLFFYYGFRSTFGRKLRNGRKMVEQITKDELMIREILSTAKMLFAQHGLKKTTMEDIANAMGKGKSTLYYYFPGKTEIFEAVVDEEMKNLVTLYPTGH